MNLMNKLTNTNTNKLNLNFDHFKKPSRYDIGLVRASLKITAIIIS